ncbi:uncharacterized protein LOC123466249 [Daphnia magna]|uniref:CUB domain-containing protein n=1 Tax=Daphnia magna TaxID=35525 RepID=A0ABR0APV7_9CRUS|nr:uncharacterized protein LOC123466249 [Daphnia magna]KAK4026998.1 hypothetical protein OUZ56_016018 [Daphnia magna]
MTSSSSVSIFSFMLMAVVCNMMVTSTGLPTKVDDAQSRQIFFVPQYNYPNYVPANFYNPYAKAIVNPAAVDPSENPNLRYAPSSLGDFGLETADFNRVSRETIIMLPSNAECLTTGTTTNGGGPCKAASQERSGTIDIRFGVDGQSANVAVTAPSANTRIRLVCTEMIAATAFTQTGKINAPSDTPRFENGFLNLVVVSTGDNARAKCSWRI